MCNCGEISGFVCSRHRAYARWREEYFDANEDPEPNDPAETTPADERPSERLVSE
jgi:hypothetical protein